MDPKDKEYPTWRYGPGGQSRVFERGETIPSGWEDHPSKVKGAAPASDKQPDKQPVQPDKQPAPQTADKTNNSDDLDSAGWPFDPALHAATKSKTTAGLWRMKVGVSRPEPKTANLDL